MRARFHLAQLHVKHPLLVPVSEYHVNGFVKLHNQERQVAVEVQFDEEGNVMCSTEDLGSSSIQEEVQTLWRQCGDPNAFIDELIILIAQKLPPLSDSSPVIPHAFLAALMSQIEELGWQYIAAVDSSFSRVKLRLHDTSKRSHLIELQIPLDFPKTAPSISWNTPEEFSYTWTPKSSFKALVETMHEHLELFCDFWAVMEDLDANSIVLEPEKPTHKDCTRRIALSPSASLVVHIDPRKPRAIPEMQVIGSESVKQNLEKSMLQNRKGWNNADFLRVNLERLFALTLPTQLSTDDSRIEITCGICMQSYVGEKAPDKHCGNAHCHRVYHNACLAAWLKQSGKARASFRTLFGECPYCSAPVTATDAK